MTREERNGKNHFFGKVRRFSIATLIAELADAAKRAVESAAPSDTETVSLGIDVRVTLFASFCVFSQLLCFVNIFVPFSLVSHSPQDIRLASGPETLAIYCGFKQSHEA